MQPAFSPGACPVLEKERFRIGIASGEVVAGYTGTEERASCTCIGDTVDLAPHTKAAGRDNLVDGATQASLGDRVPVKALGEVQFKGKGAVMAALAVKAQAQR